MGREKASRKEERRTTGAGAAHREANAPAAGERRTTSLRTVVTLAISLLVLVVTVGTGLLFVRHERETLEDELGRRLLAQGRNVASLASKPLLEDYPEFTLHPLVKKLRAENTDWSYLVVIDKRGLVKGTETMAFVDSPYQETPGLAPSQAPVSLGQGEEFSEGAEVFQVKIPVRFQDGSLVGHVFLGLSKAHVDAVVAGAVRTTAAVTGAVLLLGLALSTVIASSVVKPVKALTAGAEEIGRGNLAHRIDARSRTELGALARTFNDMAGRLEIAHREMVEKERIRRELEIAHEIEEKLLPSSETRIPGWELATFHRSAEEVGGDYYDIVPLGKERYGIAIGDVAGKGIPGLVVMAMAGALLRSHAGEHTSPSRLLAQLNDRIAPSMKRGMFITLFYGVLDARRGTFTFANAGHNPLLYYSTANSVCLPVKTTGMPLGLVRGERFEGKLADQTIEVEAGDILLLCTDGVNEAANSQEEEFGVDRIVERIGVAGEARTQADAVVKALSSDVAQFAAGARQSDDITILAMRRVSVAAPSGAASGLVGAAAGNEPPAQRKSA
jgi:serine phosphatase RsbU (regulator of sigma subunit)